MVSNVHTRTAKRLEKTLKVLAYSQIKYSFIAQDCHSAFKNPLKSIFIKMKIQTSCHKFSSRLVVHANLEAPKWFSRMVCTSQDFTASLKMFFSFSFVGFHPQTQKLELTYK